MDRDWDDGSGFGGAQPSRVDMLNYVAEMLAELRDMAAKANHDALRVLLEVARREARRDPQEKNPP
jgi:hypothetical protein